MEPKTSQFLDALHSGRVLLMDGAMGTELQRAGIPEGECYEAWNLTYPDRVRAIHQAYAAAGAECLLTHTFQSNGYALGRHGLGGQMEAINRAALRLCRLAAGTGRFVLADVGPIQAHPLVVLADPTIIRLWMRSLLPADAILLETWSDPEALEISELFRNAVPELKSVPFLLSLTYCRNFAQGKQPRGFCTFHPDSSLGKPPEWYAGQAKAHGFAALGVNCGRDIGMDAVIDIIRCYRQVTDLPLFARPNAGTPTRVGGRWVYPQTPAMMAERLPELLETGVAMVGGCCGTTPEHIAAFKPIIDSWNARHRTPGPNS